MLESKNFRTIKSEIRVLGIDDGRFIAQTQGNAMIFGVVLRGGFWLDGVMHTDIEIDGFDSTNKIISMINNSPHRNQLRLIMLFGITFAGFNVVDIKELNIATSLPVIVLMRKKPDLGAMREAIKNLPRSEERWQMVLNAGKIFEILCRGKRIYMQIAGISENDAKEIVELTSTRSSFPEPLRVAHLLASGITS